MSLYIAPAFCCCRKQPGDRAGEKDSRVALLEQGGVDQRASRGPFQPQLFGGSVKGFCLVASKLGRVEALSLCLSYRCAGMDKALP